MDPDFRHPIDTPWSSGLRFLVELIAWVAAPLAVYPVSPWASALMLAVLVLLPSVFSTPNDKKAVLVPVPGPTRVAIELLIYLNALTAPWLVWTGPTAVMTTLITLLAVILGWSRFTWLMRGAPPGG